MSRRRLSDLIPTWNRVRLVCEAVESALVQEGAIGGRLGGYRVTEVESTPPLLTTGLTPSAFVVPRPPAARSPKYCESETSDV